MSVSDLKRVGVTFVVAFLGSFFTYIVGSGFDLSQVTDFAADRTLVVSAAAAAFASGLKAAWILLPIPGQSRTQDSSGV